MLALSKKNNYEYLVALQKPVGLLDKNVAAKLKKELKRIVGKNKTIHISLDKVDEFDGSGYKELGKILELAAKKNCIIKLTVDGNDIRPRIESINE